MLLYDLISLADIGHRSVMFTFCYDFQAMTAHLLFTMSITMSHTIGIAKGKEEKAHVQCRCSVCDQ
jgi:hypothetical protein